MTNIETGVDKLVSLVKEKKKVTVSEAAKLLGVSKIVLQEWADFLQEEKVIDIDYKLTSTWLLEKKLTEEDISKKKNEFDALKEGFVRKLESSIQSINHETDNIKELKVDFDKIKKEIGSELEKVQDEVKELESYENLKKNIDQEIINQQAQFRNSIRLAHQQLLEEDKKYQALVQSIETEKANMKKEEKDLDFLRSKEDMLNSKINEIKIIIDDTHKRIDDHNIKIQYTKDHIKTLDNSASKIEEFIVKKRKTLEPLLRQSKEQEDKIDEAQKKLLAKVEQNKILIDKTSNEGKQKIEKFQEFFEKKAKLEMLLLKIEEDKMHLQSELTNLIKKAKMFNISSSKIETEKEIQNLKLAMDKAEIAKTSFKEEIKKLMGLLHK